MAHSRTEFWPASSRLADAQGAITDSPVRAVDENDHMEPRMNQPTPSTPPTPQPHGPMARRDRFADARTLVQNDRPVLVDGGAHVGRVIDRFLADFTEPTIHAFEPIPPLAQMLHQKYAGRPNVHIHCAALGASTGTVEFNVVGNVMSSSVLTPSHFASDLHGDAVAVKQTAALPQVRLDEVIDSPIDVLKLDLQGYEIEALKGAERLLDRIRLIITEVAFVPLYDNQPLFGDVDAFLRQRGFTLRNLYDLYTLEDGQLTSGDAMYVRG
jgi:FkbM family methyltransferase